MFMYLLSSHLISEALVGLEKTIYSVSEYVGVVEVCAIVYSPTINCPIVFPFDVSLSTSENTAGISCLICLYASLYCSTSIVTFAVHAHRGLMILSIFYMQVTRIFHFHIFTVDHIDYIGVSRVLSFAACETRQCLNITIVSDLVDEPVEEFDVTLERTTGLDTRISLAPVDARVIINDDNESKSALY